MFVCRYGFWTEQWVNHESSTVVTCLASDIWAWLTWSNKKLEREVWVKIFVETQKSTDRKIREPNLVNTPKLDLFYRVEVLFREYSPEYFYISIPRKTFTFCGIWQNYGKCIFLVEVSLSVERDSRERARRKGGSKRANVVLIISYIYI